MSITRMGVIGMLLGLGFGISLGLGAGCAVAEPSAHGARGDKATPAKHATGEASGETEKGMARPAPRPVAASHPGVVNTEVLDRLRVTAGALTTMSIDELLTSVERARMDVLSRQLRGMTAEIAARNDRVAELTAGLAKPGLTPAERNAIESRIAHLNSLTATDQTRLQGVLANINQIADVLTSLKLDKLKQRQIMLDAIH